MKDYKWRIWNYADKNETLGLSIENCGYHDFRYVKPIKRMHVQAGFTLHFVDEGSGTLVLGGNTFHIKAGDFFFIPKNEKMMYYPTESNPWRYYWFFLSGDGAENLGKKMGFSLSEPVKKAGDPAEIHRLIEPLFSGEYTLDERYLKSLSVLYNIASKLTVPENTNGYICNLNISEKIREIVEMNYQNPYFSMDILADMTFVSHSYICKLFKEQTGVSVKRYMLDFRLEKAAEILEKKYMPIRKLAEEVGFNDQFHFMKEFKKKYGVTVKEYAESKNAVIDKTE